MKGKFIIVEGIDGSGKGEQIKRLSYEIFDADKKNNVLLTREPTKFSKYGIEVRERLAKEKDPKSHAEEFTELYILDRKEHQDKQIIPSLDYGTHVISDRFDFSTYSYQQTQGMSIEKIYEMHKKEGIITPDLTIIIDVSPEIALKRITKDGMREGTEKFEKLGFMKELRKNYLKLKDHDLFKDRKIVIIDGENSIEKVYSDLKAEVSKLIPL